MSQLRIAIADDDPRMRAYVVYLVKTLGHKVSVEVENGAKLVESCLAVIPDLIISDMQMPVMTGLEAVDRIWKTQLIPAILVSGLSEWELFAGRSSGRKPVYLMKPFDLRELTESIRRASVELARTESAPQSRLSKTNAALRVGAAPTQTAPRRAEAQNKSSQVRRNNDGACRLSPGNAAASYPARLSASNGRRSDDR